MDENMKVVFIQSQIVCARIRLEAMLARNEEARAQGLYPVYNENDLMAIMDEYKIGHNDVIGYLTGR